MLEEPICLGSSCLYTVYVSGAEFFVQSLAVQRHPVTVLGQTVVAPQVTVVSNNIIPHVLTPNASVY